jgi:tetratricopeptide (TPR) repeat protein
LGDKQGAIDDFNLAIKFNPNYAYTYNNRGLVRYELGDNQGAIGDFQQAANLFQQQGNIEAYQMTLEIIIKLQQQ